MTMSGSKLSEAREVTHELGVGEAAGVNDAVDVDEARGVSNTAGIGEAGATTGIVEARAQDGVDKAVRALVRCLGTASTPRQVSFGEEQMR
ncbi:unnamed protein product [Ilex paraguariensis]|uniref:Uncharacterized protein n=1 Tax=Ilex paraguariensis TaxID=185542 RepID=A0ABC8UCE9_9AQUA